MSCPNSAYEQEYRRKFIVREIESFLNGFVECRAVQKREIKIVVLEVKINTLKGEVEFWKGVYWRYGLIRLPFPLENVRNVREMESRTYRMNGPKL